MAVKVNRTYHLIVDKTKDVPKDAKYQEYRKKWNEYPTNFIVNDYPLHIDIETTSDCNLKCPMCPRTFMKDKTGYMDMDLYKKIIDEIGGKVCAIKLNWRGEPTMHPKLAEMIRYAKQKGIMEVLLNSNGTCLNEKLSRDLILSGLDSISFSFDSLDKKEYEKIRVGADYEKTINNIKQFIEIRKRLGMKKPWIRLQMVNLKESRKDIDEFKKYWESMVDQVSYLDHIKWVDKVAGKVDIKEGFACAPLWQRMVIAYDGTITCVGDSYLEHPIGNAKRDSVLAVWKDNVMQKMRELHRNGEYHKIEICRKCQMPC